MIKEDKTQTIVQDPGDPTRAITDEMARTYEPQCIYEFSFQKVDEPISTPAREDASEPSDDELESLVDKFPAPAEWYSE